MAYPRFQRARSFKVVRRTSGDVAITSTTMVDLDTTMDIALNCQIGDVLEANINGAWSNEAIAGRIEAVTLVSGAPVNTFSGIAWSTTSDGVAGWHGIPSVYGVIGGPAYLMVAAGDIANGLVAVRLKVRVTTAGTKTLTASATNPLMFAVKNLGPVDPN